MSAASPSSSNSSPDLSSLSSATASVPIRSMTDVPVDGSDAPISPFSSAELSLAHDDQQNYHQQPRPKLGNGEGMTTKSDYLLDGERKSAEGLAEEKMPEGSSKAQLIALPQVSAVPPSSKWPPLPLSVRLLSSHRFLLALVFLLSVLAIVLVVCLAIVVVVSSAQWHQINEEDAAFLNREISWRSNCERKCNAKFDVPPLILISMDGFRADFLQRGKTEAVSRIIQCGASTEFMMPSYPSKTFPNHFTIATGLYPESHGIVDNYFYDEQMPEEKNFTRSSRNPAWYKGEPIWNTVAKNGKKSGIFFWPGSEVPIQGIRPTYRYSYNASIPFSKRVDQVIKWLRLDENERPAFLAIYFEQPDSAMHQEGPDSDAVNSALIYVDAMINYLMQQLDNNGFLGCINLIIVSDHGAQKLRDDMAVTLDRFVDMADPGIREVFPGIVGHIKLRENNETLLNKVLAPFECSGGQIFRVYTRETMPRRYHYARSGRIGELVIDSAVGTKLFKTAEKMNASKMKGEHGYDNRVSSMRAVFGAWGPSIKKRHREKPFQNIELYNLFTALMQLPVTDNGTLGRLNSLLRSPPNADAEPMAELAECAGAQLVKCGDGCHFELHYSGRPFGTVSLPSAPPSSPTSSRPDASSASADQSEGFSAPTTKVPIYSAQHCKYAEHLLMPELLQQYVPMCVLRLCNATMVFNLHRQAPLFVESQLTAPVPSIDHRANCSAHFLVPKHGEEEKSEGEKQQRKEQVPIPTTEQTTKMERTAQKGATTEATNKQNWDKMTTNQMMEERSLEKQRQKDENGDKLVWTDDQTEGINDQPERTTDQTGGTNDQSSSPTISHEKCVRFGTSANNASGTARISLFSDNDYARYIHQGQIQVPIGFYNGVWQQVLSLVRQYVQHYKRLLMWSGPVWDRDNDGLADPPDTAATAADGADPPPPSHVFLILVRCPGTEQWDARGRWCSKPENTTTLSFVLPLVERDLNCLFPVEYIFRHTARIRDIELLTGNEWFTDREIYPLELALQLRTYINEQLWQLELTK